MKGFHAGRPLPATTLLRTAVVGVVAGVVALLWHLLWGTRFVGDIAGYAFVYAAVLLFAYRRARGSERGPAQADSTVASGPRWWLWVVALWTPLTAGHRIWFTRALVAFGVALTCGSVGFGLMFAGSLLQSVPGDPGLYILLIGLCGLFAAMLAELLTVVCVVAGAWTYWQARGSASVGTVASG